MNKCKDCKFWRNKQRELEYSEKYGFCCNEIQMEAESYEEKFKILVHDAYTHVTHDLLETQGTLKSYKCELALHKDYGCIFWESK